MRLSITTLCLGLAVIAAGCNQPVNSSTTTANQFPTKTQDRPAQPVANAATITEATAAGKAEAPPKANPSAKQQDSAFLDGRYWVGHTGQGLEIDGDRYRYDDEGGTTAWRPVSQLKFIQSGVVYDGDAYWCLSSMKPKASIGSCSENGWVTQTASKSVTRDDRKLLFSCATEDTKQILLYDAGATIDYSFGKVVYPLEQDPWFDSELDLKVPRTAVENYQWQGVGRNMTYSITVPNGNVGYRVFWSLDKLDRTHTPEGGVEVLENGKSIATVKCKGNITSKLKGLSL